MKVIETNLEGVLVIEPDVFGDKRGFFKECFHSERYAEIGIAHDFVQDNLSRSRKGTIRGLHLQRSHPQGKLVWCSDGAVFDVVVDVDPTSSSFGEHWSIELSSENHRQLWIPPGYAHGFCVISETADLFYKCSDFYYPDDEGGLLWNDPEVRIEWPIANASLSDKDQKLPTLNAIRARGFA